MALLSSDAKVTPLRFIFCLLMTLVLAEAVVRVYFKLTKREINSFRPSYLFADEIQSDRTRFKSHAFSPFFPRANDKRTLYVYRSLIGKTVAYSYENNSLGFRTPERPYQKPAGVKRIVVLGGSTAGDGTTNETTWPAILEEKLNFYYKDKGLKIEVVNLAMDAGISTMSLGILNLYGVHYEPDLVISYDGVNDLWFSAFCPNILPDYSNYVRPFNDKVKSFQFLLPKWAFQSYALSFISFSFDRFLKLETYLPEQVWKPTLVYTDKTFKTGLPLYHRNLKLMRGVCKEYGCRFLASIPHWLEYGELVQSFDDQTREFFKREGINYLDLQNILPHKDYSLHTDYYHWTDKGTEAAAEEWFKKIVSENLLF